MEADVITLQTLYEFKLDHIDADGKVVGDLAPTGLRPTVLKKFERRGIEVPQELFMQPAGGDWSQPSQDRSFAQQEAAW
jgi:pilus assembly protein CpaF